VGLYEISRKCFCAQILLREMYFAAIGGQDGGQVRFDAGRRNELTHPTFNCILLLLVGKMVGKFVSTLGVETNLPTLHLIYYIIHYG